MPNPTPVMPAEISALGLAEAKALHVRQLRELVELIGVETRNKYQITDDRGQPIAFAAEQQKGFLGLLFRMVLGHWRSFSLHFFDNQRRLAVVAEHPFRWFFQRLVVKRADGRALGAIQQRFSLLSKRFDVEDETGRVLLEVCSPIWRPWTFEFRGSGRVKATVRKKWSGGFSEILTDRDNFHVEFTPEMSRLEERALVLAAALFIDLQYFEAKAGR